MLHFLEVYPEFFLAPMLMLFGVGMSLVFFGTLVALATALGNKQWFWGIGMLLTWPVVALPYCLSHMKMARYPAKFLIAGLIMIIIPVLVYVWLVQSASA